MKKKKIKKGKPFWRNIVEIWAVDKDDDSRYVIVIQKMPNGKYRNCYGYDRKRDFQDCTAGYFDTLEKAEEMLLKHRPSAENYTSLFIS